MGNMVSDGDTFMCVIRAVGGRFSRSDGSKQKNRLIMPVYEMAHPVYGVIIS